MNSPTRPPLRVVFCGCDGIFSGLVLRRLLACPNLAVVAAVASTRILRAPYGLIRGAWHQIRTSGLSYSAYLWTATVAAELLCSAAFHRLARRHRIPTLATRSINDPTGLAFVTVAQPDVLVSAFFNQRIGSPIRDIARIAAVNVHPSLLPNFRGVDPVFFSRLRRALPLGATVHHLNDDFDAGPIVAQDTLAFTDAESIFRTTARLFDLGGRILIPALCDPEPVPSGRSQPAPGHYDSWPTPPAVRQLRKQRIALIRPADLRWARGERNSRAPT